MTTRKDIAKELLTVFSGQALYKEKQMLARGELVPFARKMKKRARLQVWLGIGLAITFVFNGVLSVIDYGSQQTTYDLVFGLISIAAGLIFLIFWGRSGERVHVQASMALSILEAPGSVDQAPGNEPRERPRNAISLAQKLGQITDMWQPRVIAELNDYQFKLARIKGEFVWHSHADTDEAFMVLDGVLTIEFRDGSVNLDSGSLYVVPQGVEHRPVAHAECSILLIEPRGVTNTGTAGGDMTAPNDQWL